jgi:hypothetical protein
VSLEIVTRHGLAALQTVVEPEEERLVFAIVTAWLRSWRRRFPEDVSIAA